MKEPLDPNYPIDSMFGNSFGYLARPLVPLHQIVKAQLEVDVYVLGIPFDLGCTGRSGTRSGPTCIRNASTNLRWEQCKWPHRNKVFEDLKVIDCGDLEIGPGESKDTIHEIQKVISTFLTLSTTPKQSRTLCFGGDHLVTLPILLAYANHFGKTLAMIHFDAHTDTYKVPMIGSMMYDHGTMFFKERMEGILSFEQSVQVGIRTEYDYDDHPYTVLDTNHVHAHTASEISQQIRNIVTKNGKEPDQMVYLTFDIDCLDPSCAPGTGTPVVGGLHTQRALEIVRGLKGLNVVGADVVEVNDYLDHAQMTSLAAATLGYEFLYLFSEASRLYGPGSKKEAE